MHAIQMLGYITKCRPQILARNICISVVNYTSSNDQPESTKVGGFAKSFEKQSHLLQETNDNQTFASLLRNSKLMDVS